MTAARLHGLTTLFLALAMLCACGFMWAVLRFEREQRAFESAQRAFDGCIVGATIVEAGQTALDLSPCLNYIPDALPVGQGT